MGSTYRGIMTNNLSVDDYEFPTWGEKFPLNVVTFSHIQLDESWKDFMEGNRESTADIEETLGAILKISEGKVALFPYPDLLFNAFNLTPLGKTRVVILGQDPYFNFEVTADAKIPQAMGLSFSVPKGVAVPSSLGNIYKNLLKFGHIQKKPEHGNLEAWARQGCLMLNTSLTVQHKHPNSHTKYWEPLTDNLITYISEICPFAVFVLWGSPALKKLHLIDTDKHAVSISSHPSGLSCAKKLRQYDCFNDADHFGFINSRLKNKGMVPIDWNIA